MVTKRQDSGGERSPLAVAPNVFYYGVAVDQVEMVLPDFRRRSRRRLPRTGPGPLLVLAGRVG